MEEWKAIEGTNGRILVSNEGRVKSLLRAEQNILKATPDKKGYLRLRVTLDRKKLSYKIHREVAKAFIPNPNNYPQVNHIDGDKSNNRVSNLEWVTNRDNAHHAIENGLWDSVFEGAKRANATQRKRVVATKGDETICFESIVAAQRHFNSRHISDVCKGRRDHVKGWHFAYESEVMS